MERVKKIVLDLCKNTDFRWKIHIQDVVRESLNLADIYCADKEIVGISAWLHDIKKVRGEPGSHHIHGAKEVAEILVGLGYGARIISQVKHCILTHSSDKNYLPETLEAKILLDADAISHFKNLPIIAYSSYLHNPPEEVNQWIIRKYQKLWGKMVMPESKAMIKPEYEAIKLLIK